MMKRFFVLLAASLFGLALLLPPAAADYIPVESAEVAVPYYISELDMEIFLPNALIVYTRDGISSSAAAEEYGITEEDVENTVQNMKDSDIYLFSYLLGVDAGHPEEYSLVMLQMFDSAEYTDLNDCTDAELDSIFKEVQSSSPGMKYDAHTEYQHAQAKFLVMSYAMPGDGYSTYGLQYYTIFNSQEILITFNYTAMPSSDDTTNSIIDSIYFYTAPETYVDDTDTYYYDGSYSESSDESPFRPILVVIVIVAIVASVLKKGKKGAAKKPNIPYAQPGETSTPPESYRESAPTPRREPEESRYSPAAPVKRPEPAKTMSEREMNRPAHITRSNKPTADTERHCDLQNPEDAWNYTMEYKQPVAYCPSCGAKVYEGGRRCPLCGAKVRKGRDTGGF